jgi:hypothetical protein
MALLRVFCPATNLRISLWYEGYPDENVLNMGIYGSYEIDENALLCSLSCLDDVL